MKIIWTLILWTAIAWAGVRTELPEAALAGVGTPQHPKVWISWDRYYDWKGVTDILKRLERAYPQLATVTSIGKSYLGKDIWLITITNPKTGKPEEKPGFYIDGNIHSNEVQGTEVALYTAWYLLEMYAQNALIRELVDTRTFYIVPTINPDARDYFLHEPNTPHSPRSGLIPRDDDGDGLVNEDDFDDLDGDGFIVQMRKKDPLGEWRPDPRDPRLMVRVGPDEQGEYTLLGWEGIDNDGDGLVNEDRAGFYDPNRNWPWRWMPRYVQFGADEYPFNLPETRAVGDFWLQHPNIAGAQSYHNAGGMILRGPGDPDDPYPQPDVQLYEAIARRGEQILPGYRYLVVYKDMYPVYGGELNWFYSMQGALTFTNELWTPFNFYRDSVNVRNWFGNIRKQYTFDRYVLFEDAIVPWKKIHHPQYGEIEIGGVKKHYTRMPPGFLLLEECHRNMAFTLYHAYQLPLLQFGEIHQRPLGNGLTEVLVEIRNVRLQPTHLMVDLQHKITPPDVARFHGKGIDVVAGFVVSNPYLGIATEQEHHPERLTVRNVPGKGRVWVKWLVKGRGKATVEFRSIKGGTIRQTITLK